MNVSCSFDCMVSDEFQLWVHPMIARWTLGLEDTVDEWTKIDIPPITQAIDTIGAGNIDQQCVIIVTVDGRLLILNRKYPNGNFINCPFKIKYIARWTYINDPMLKILMIIDHDNRLYNISLTSLIECSQHSHPTINPVLLSDDAISVTHLRGSYSLWLSSLSDDISVTNGINTYILIIIDRPSRLIDRLLITDENWIYRVNGGRGCIPKLIRLFKVDYEIVDIVHNNDPDYNQVLILDDNGIVRIYDCCGNKIRGITNVNRFIVPYCYSPMIELNDNRLVSDRNLTASYGGPFKLLNLEEYYRLRIKSAMG